jgi:4-amino-4-deoxy-L-arabinose transferase-like glycosyltransferase
MSFSRAARWKYEIAAGLLLLAMLAQLLVLITYQSGIADEQFYPGVGKYFVENGDFSPFAFRYHPPLAYYINSLLLYSDSNPVWQSTPFDMGLLATTYGFDNLLLLTRLPIALLAIVLGIFIFAWSRALFGKKAALFAVFLYSFEPTLLAHSSVATTDLAAAAFIFIAMYALWKLEQRQTFRFAALAGFCLGLALLSKFTALILVPVVLAFFLYKPVLSRSRRLASCLRMKFEARHPFRLRLIGLCFLVAFITVWAAYGFQVSTVLDSVHSREKALGFLDQKYPDGLQRELALGAMNTPLPAAGYVTGLGYAAFHSSTGHENYFFGEISTSARWHYHPVAFLLKTPLPLLLLLGMAAAGAICWRKKIDWRGRKHLIAPVLAYAVFLWFAVSLNIGLRHSLPLYPFIFVLASPLVTFKLKAPRKEKVFRAALIALAIWYVAEAALILPHNMSYFNELVGSQNGWLYLNDPDVDWGQEVKGLARYIQENGISGIYFAKYMPDVYTDQYISDYSAPGCTPQNGLYAIGAAKFGFMESRACYEWLLDYKPIDRIGYAIFIWDITDAEA